MPDYYNPPSYDDADFNFIETYSPPAYDDADFNFALAVYSVLSGTSNVFTAIWADPDAGRENAKMYALSWGPGASLSVLDMATKVIYDFYTETHGGRQQDEKLDANDTRDLNVYGL